MAAQAETFTFGELRIPARIAGLPEFRAWAVSSAYPESLRASWVEGEVLLDMSPEAFEGHNKVKLTIAAALAELARERDLGEVYTDGALLTNERAGPCTEPDCMLVTWGAFTDGRATLVPKAATTNEYVELVGAPDLVVEVVSDSSVRKDKRLLRDAYARAGIAEYWLVDARGDDVQFAVLTLGASGSYVETPGEAQASPLLGCRVRLVRRRNRLARYAYELVTE